MKELQSRIPPLFTELKKLAVVSRYVNSNFAKMGVFYSDIKVQSGDVVFLKVKNSISKP